MINCITVKPVPIEEETYISRVPVWKSFIGPETSSTLPNERFFTREILFRTPPPPSILSIQRTLLSKGYPFIDEPLEADLHIFRVLHASARDAYLCKCSFAFIYGFRWLTIGRSWLVYLCARNLVPNIYRIITIYPLVACDLVCAKRNKKTLKDVRTPRPLLRMNFIEFFSSVSYSELVRIRDRRFVSVRDR